MNNQMPSQMPNQMPKMPNQMPNQNPNQMPGQMPGQTPNKMPNQMPGQMPNQNPNQMPGQMPSQPPKMPNQTQPKLEMPELRRMYPDIFYKIQPYILMICDQMDTYYGDKNAPTQEMLDKISEDLYKIIMEMYPELEEYARKNTGTEPTVSQVITTSPYFYGRGYRSRGLLRDLVDILFLSEFYRRRRRYY